MAKMLRCKFLPIITFVLCHVIVDSENSTRTLVISNERVTWLEGQRQCAEKNGRLLSSDDFSIYLQEVLKRVSGDYWLGDIKKVSEWIHILGCYSKASIENDLSSPTNFTIALTPGRCQEYCFYEKMSLFFAIKEETCYCLKSDSNLSDTASVINCDYKCNSEEPKACGSKTGPYLSVYKTTNTSGKNTLCMSIACDGGNKLYKAENCTVPLTPYCSNNKTAGTAGTWNVSNAMCLKENGYLDGEANLDDPTGKCNEIRARFPTTYLFWIGIRRQVYKTADKGYPTESNSLKECEFLNGRDFSMMQTNNCKKKYYAVCLVPNNISNISNADQTAREERENNVTDDVGPLVGGVFGGLFLIAGVILLTIIVIRRHQKGKREDQSTLKFESENHTSISELKVNQSTDNDRYPEMNSNGIKEETYYKSQDDYDILGKRRSKIKGTQSENIYNHAESTTNQNHYASAAQVSKRISGEDLYDHTNNSEYGTVSEIDNDNMYSES